MSDASKFKIDTQMATPDEIDQIYWRASPEKERLEAAIALCNSAVRGQRIAPSEKGVGDWTGNLRSGGIEVEMSGHFTDDEFRWVIDMCNKAGWLAEPRQSGSMFRKLRIAIRHPNPTEVYEANLVTRK